MSYPLTIGGIGCYELNAESGRVTIDATPGQHNYVGTQVYVTNWDDQILLANALYLTGHPYVAYCYATNFKFDPWGKPVGFDGWEQVKVTVGYKNLSYDPTVLKEISVETSVENVTLESDGTQFATGSGSEATRVNINPNQFISFSQITVTMHNQTSIAESSWIPLFNTVNASTWSPGTGFHTWAANTVLYQGYTVQQKTVLGGSFNFEVSHKFLGSEFDMRSDYNPHIGAMDLVVSKVTGNYKYNSASWSVLPHA